MSHVYVVMGNDYPDAVFTTASAAELYCARKRAEPESMHDSGATKIYWNWYSLELRDNLPTKEK